MLNLQGTGVALVTPFDHNNDVDYPALEAIINHVISNGANYLVALGTTAETPTLKQQEKIDLLSFIIKKTNKRVPVIAGIGGNNTAEVIQQIQELGLNEIDGILSVCPYYNKPSQEGIYQHFKQIALSTEKPIILYNVPGRTVTNMLPDTVIRLANDFQNIIAIKEASGNIAQCMELASKAPADFTLLSGDDDLVLIQIALGFQGVISVIANGYTKTFTQMVNKALKGDFAEARYDHFSLLPIIKLLFDEGNPTGIKCALNQKGLCENVLRLPLIPASADLINKLYAFPI